MQVRPDEILLTPAEVQERLRVSRSKCYAILASGQIKVLRLGKLIRVRESDLTAFIDATTKGGPA